MGTGHDITIWQGSAACPASQCDGADVAPIDHDITIRLGSTFCEAFQIYGADDKLLDLTGWSVFAQVRSQATRPVVADLVPVITDSAEGEIILITIMHEQSALLPAGNYYWDLMLETPDGVRIGPVFAGRALLHRVITQA